MKFLSKHAMATLVFLPLVLILSIVVINPGFVTAYLTNPDRVGSLAASSFYLTKAMVKPVTWIKKKNRRILQLGVGDGGISTELVKILRHTDQLDIVELDSDRCTEMSSRFGRHNVKFYCMDFARFYSGRQYDVIVSNLAYNSLSAGRVSASFDKIEKLLAKGGFLAYFDYKWLPSLYPLFLGGEKKEDLSKARSIVASVTDRRKILAEDIYFNFTPVRVYYLKY